MVTRSYASRPAFRPSTRPHRTHLGTINGSRCLGAALGRARIHCRHASARSEPPGLPCAWRRCNGRPTPPPPAPRRNPVGGPPLTQPLAPLTQCKDLSFLTRAGGFGWEGDKKKDVFGQLFLATCRLQPHLPIPSRRRVSSWKDQGDVSGRGKKT